MYSVNSTGAIVGGQRWNKATDVPGYIDIKVKNPQGATFTKLLNISQLSNNLTGLSPTTSPYLWETLSVTALWATGVYDTNGQKAYPVGTYTIWAESTLNSMKDNYKGTDGAVYTKKTVSPVYTINLGSDTVAIVSNKGTTVRSKSFAVTVTGKANMDYYLWVKGTSMMSNTTNNAPPIIMNNQEGVVVGDLTAGAYSPQNYGTRTIASDVPSTPEGNRSYAKVSTGPTGIRTIEFTTSQLTKAQKYTIRVETATPSPGDSNSKSDEVDVAVEKGAITVVASGSQSYYLGEEIKFTGTNSETYQTYLFLVGPNLPVNGALINDPNPRIKPSQDGIPATFQVVDVDGATNTWSWKWGTANIALDAGTYTIYAVSDSRNAGNLTNVAFGTTSILIKKPFVYATASQSTVAQGDKLFISGVAEGKPTLGVQIWVVGKNYLTVETAAVSADASFKYEITGTKTKNLAPGQYFLVAQHPMQNGVFDIRLDTTDSNKMYNAQSKMTFFTIQGAGSLQGTDAAEALVQGITDANVDDTYTKLQFLVENPLITIKPIGDKHVGDKFTIIADTNLAVDDEVLVEVYSSSFKPTQKSQSGEFSGATGTVRVKKGELGMNKITFDIDSSTFKPDEYIVREDAILQEATGSALFNVLESTGALPTVIPTTVVTTVATTVPTTVPTAAPVVTNTTAVPTKPTASPGAGALLALIGLGAVGFIVVRRE
jgi:hypothetical protein